MSRSRKAQKKDQSADRPLPDVIGLAQAAAADQHFMCLENRTDFLRGFSNSFWSRCSGRMDIKRPPHAGHEQSGWDVAEKQWHALAEPRLERKIPSIRQRFFGWLARQARRFSQ